MSLTAWQERLLTAAKSGRPYIDDESSYNRMRRRGMGVRRQPDSLYAGVTATTPSAPLRVAGGASITQRMRRRYGRPAFRSHHGVTASLPPYAKERTTGYGGDSLPGISFTMNLLPFLPDGVEAVRRVIDGSY